MCLVCLWVQVHVSSLSVGAGACVLSVCGCRCMCLVCLWVQVHVSCLSVGEGARVLSVYGCGARVLTACGRGCIVLSVCWRGHTCLVCLWVRVHVSCLSVIRLTQNVLNAYLWSLQGMNISRISLLSLIMRTPALHQGMFFMCICYYIIWHEWHLHSFTSSSPPLHLSPGGQK